MDLRSLLNCEASGKDNGRHMQWLAGDLKAVKVAIEAVLQRLDEDGYKTTASSPSSAGQQTISHSTFSLNMPSSSEQRSWRSLQHPSTPAFPFFNRLPHELRIKIWQIAALEGRFFKPVIEPIRLGFADSAIQDQLGLNPCYVTFQWAFKPPILRQVCREALKATDDIAAFAFGLTDTTRSSCWLNQRRDIVFIDANMIAKLDPQNLCRIRALGFPETQFNTLDKCLEVLSGVLQYAPQCDTIYFCFCARTVQGNRSLPVSFTESRQLQDDDLIGSYESLGAPPGPVRWGQLRQVICTVWADCLRAQGLGGVQAPFLVGIDVYNKGL